LLKAQFQKNVYSNGTIEIEPQEDAPLLKTTSFIVHNPRLDYLLVTNQKQTFLL